MLNEWASAEENVKKVDGHQLCGSMSSLGETGTETMKLSGCHRVKSRAADGSGQVRTECYLNQVKKIKK